MPTTTTPKTFDEIRKHTNRRRGCYKCGTTETVASVKILCTEIKEDRTMGNSIATYSRNFCESCAVVVYSAVEAAYERTARQGKKS